MTYYYNETILFEPSMSSKKWILLGNYQKQPPEVFYKKKVFLNIQQNSQENTCFGLSYLMKA